MAVVGSMLNKGPLQLYRAVYHGTDLGGHTLGEPEKGGGACNFL